MAEDKISGAKLLLAITDTMHSYTRNLSDTELAAFRKTCKRVTTTNCEWRIYEASISMLRFADEELRDRKIVAVQKCAQTVHN